jgi:nucleoside-diphosphate-sugar epimerase
MQHKTVLVLGSEGQIGKPLVNYLKNQGLNVLTFDIDNDPVEDLRIRDNRLLERYMTESEFVFFLAYDVGGAKYLYNHQHTYKFIDNNIRIMSNTFDALERVGVPFIFASSQMADMTESTYGLLKEVGERYTTSIGGLNVKLWNVYGPEVGSEKSHVITDFIEKAQAEKKIEMMTDGLEIRQLLHADDCASCMLSLCKEYDNLDKTKNYHMTSFEWVSILDVATEVSSNFGGVKIIPSSTTDSVHSGWKVEPDKHILNYWKPNITLSEGIKDIIEGMQ